MRTEQQTTITFMLNHFPLHAIVNKVFSLRRSLATGWSKIALTPEIARTTTHKLNENKIDDGLMI